MSQDRYKVGDLLPGGHVVLAVHETDLAVVYVCKQEGAKGPVYRVCKTFRLANEVCQKLFERELTNWSRLPAHPNIVQTEKVDKENQLLVLEFVPGPNLREVAWKCPVHPKYFLHWTGQIAGALRFLHEENQFVHRDLRPQNILIDSRDALAAKISDLGIGKPFDPTTAKHTIIGTYAYMAPEVYSGRTDFRSDIFSLGATLYFLLTGNYAAKLSTRDMGPVTTPSSLAPDVPAEVSTWLLKCLEPKPENRHQTIGEVVSGLESFTEWPIQSTPYDFCKRHDFFFYAPSRRFDCPFCVYQKGFEKHEEHLRETLKERG